MKNGVQPNQQTKAIEIKLEDQEWYQALIEECRATIVEGVFTSRWALIGVYHQLGKRILEENDNFERIKVYGKQITQRVAASLGKSQRTIEQAVQFAQKYPDLDLLPAGKNVTWRKVVNEYLPAHQEGTETECNHPESEIEEVSFLKCKECGKSLEGHSGTITKEELANNIKNWTKVKEFSPLQINEADAPVPFILSGEREWEKYHQNPHRTLPELWKLWKKIQNIK